MQNNPGQMVTYGAPAGQPMAFNAAAMPFQAPQWGHQQQQFPQGMGMLPMMSQQPPQWPQMQQFPPQPQPGIFHPQGMRMGFMPGVNPTPPTYPPPEEKPPLPSEPPPPLPSTPHETRPPLPNEQPKPPLPKDDIRPRPPSEPAPEKPAPPARPPSPDPALVAELEKVKKEEVVFLEQYKQWKKQYDDWREQNQNHPNKDQYEQYLSQWKMYEGQMESRRTSIAKQIAGLEKKLADCGAHTELLPKQQQGNKFGKDHDSTVSPFSQDRQRGWKSSRENQPVAAEKHNLEKKQEKCNPIEGDDIGEEDMNLDDEEETAGGGIIESSSHPPPHENWPNNSSERPELLSQDYGQKREDGPGGKFWESQENNFQGGSLNENPNLTGQLSGPPRFSGQPGGSRFPMKSSNGEPRFPGGPPNSEPRFPVRQPSGGPLSREPRFPVGPSATEPRFPNIRPNGPQEWEQSATGQSGFHRGRGQNDRGMAGQGPRFGWRGGGGGGPRFQMPPQGRGRFPGQTDSDWNEYEETHSGYQDDNGEQWTEEGDHTSQENWYEETDIESQQCNDSNYGVDDNTFGAGKDFSSNRGRGGPGAFQRGRGSDLYNSRGRGFDRGRGNAFNRGGYGGFSGGAFSDRNDQYEEEANESDHYNVQGELTSWRGRGRGGRPARGRGGFQSFLSTDYADDVQAEDNLDDIERQAQLQYDDEIQDNREENFQMGFHGRGRGGIYRGRGGHASSFGNEENPLNQRGQHESQDNYEPPQEDFNNRGRGTFPRHGFIGRGRGETNPASEGMGRGVQRGHGAYRGGGGPVANFLDREEYVDNYGYGGQENEEFQDKNEAYPRQPPEIHGRGRGATHGFSFGRGTFGLKEDDEFIEGNESQWKEDNQRPSRGRGFGSRQGMGRGVDWPQNSQNVGNDRGYTDETEAGLRRSMYENRGPVESSVTEQTEDKEEEPFAKRGRFDFDDRDPYGRFPPPFAFEDRYRDPFSRFPDRFSRDPYFDPFPPPPFERLPDYDRFGPYDRTLPEKKSFIPAESIDYGHGESDKEKKRAALQQKEVIDYGHGRGSESKEDHLAMGNQHQEFRAQRALDVDERQEDQRFGYQKESSSDQHRSQNVQVFDYSNVSGQESNTRGDFDVTYRDSHINRNYSDSVSKSGENVPGGRRQDFKDHLENRRGPSEDPFGRNHTHPYGRDTDDRANRNDNDPYNKNLDDRFIRDIDNRFSGDHDDRYDRDLDRGRINRHSQERLSLFNRDSDDSLNRDRQLHREGLYSKETRREESPRGRVSDFDDRIGVERGSSYRREDRSRSKDNLRVEENRDNIETYGRDISPFRRRPDRDDPYLSLGRESLRSADARSGMNRWSEKDLYSMGSSPRDQRYGVMAGARDIYGEGHMSSPSRNSPMVRGPSAPAPLPVAEVKKVEDLLCPPGRQSRPPQLVVIIRGLPGSGKTYVSKLLREKEIKFGGAAPRMLCLDDYFMVEVEKQEVDPDTGKKVKKKVLEYEYEQPVEEAYRQSLLKSFKKTVDDGFFPFIIVDATNEKVVHFSEFWSYAKSRGFQVYVGELNVDVATCIQRNIHNWTEWDIEKVKSNWEPLPNHYITLDLRWLLQDDSIAEVEMEDTDPNEAEEEKEKEKEENEEKAQDEDEEETGFESIYKKSKWELDSSEKTLDKLDGIPVSKKHIAEHQSLKDYLQLDEPDQLDDDYFSRESLPGKKRVRWADLEEKKTQNRRRDLGFIVGQTQRDWERITDDDFATKALNQTKYFYKN